MPKLTEAFVEILSMTKGFDKGLDGAEAKLNSFLGHAQSIMQAAALAAGGGAVGKFFLEAADAGSDLGETMSKVKEVFGSSTGAIVSMSQSMADQFGSVKKVTLDAAANIGLVAQGAGLGSAAAADMAQKLVRLADDASSFYNVELDVALEKIRSGLVGEAEPLRAFGVLLSEANMKTKAQQMGLKSLGGELTESQKVMARSQLIIEGLNKASGDHERTLGSYANQVRRLKGEFQNWKADFGAPIAGGAADVISQLRKGDWSVLNPFASGEERQKRADAAAGVNHSATGGGGVHIETTLEKEWRQRLAYDQFMERRRFERGKFEGSGEMQLFGPLGFAGMNRLMATAMMPQLDKEIAKQREEMHAWSGSHQMGVEQFLSSAQEKLLSRDDQVKKDQLKELIKIREAVRELGGLTMTQANKAGGMKFRPGAREQ